MSERPEPAAVVAELLRLRFPGANAALLAGSVVRGAATASSDLDVVVLYPRLERAWRESLVHRGWPIEAFVHDLETLSYFCEEDRRLGVPVMLTMLLEGIADPAETTLVRAARRLAGEGLGLGPLPLTPEQLEERRYQLTDLVDDLRDPRSDAEAVAAGVKLYEPLVDFRFRAAGEWSARGKAIPRHLARTDPALHDRFLSATEALFAGKDPAPLVALAEDLLRPYGGPLFAGFRREAPPGWRRS